MPIHASSETFKHLIAVGLTLALIISDIKYQIFNALYIRRYVAYATFEIS